MNVWYKLNQPFLILMIVIDATDIYDNKRNVDVIANLKEDFPILVITENFFQSCFSNYYWTTNLKAPMRLMVYLRISNIADRCAAILHNSSILKQNGK